MYEDCEIVILMTSFHCPSLAGRESRVRDEVAEIEVKGVGYTGP